MRKLVSKIFIALIVSVCVVLNFSGCKQRETSGNIRFTGNWYEVGGGDTVAFFPDGRFESKMNKNITMYSLLGVDTMNFIGIGLLATHKSHYYFKSDTELYIEKYAVNLIQTGYTSISLVKK